MMPYKYQNSTCLSYTDTKNVPETPIQVPKWYLSNCFKYQNRTCIDFQVPKTHLYLARTRVNHILIIYYIYELYQYTEKENIKKKNNKIEFAPFLASDAYNYPSNRIAVCHANFLVN